MTTPPQLLDSSQHNSTNEDVLLKQGEKYPTIDNDTSSVRTDSTTVPAANPPRRVTISPTKSNMADHIRELVGRLILALPEEDREFFAGRIRRATENIETMSVQQGRFERDFRHWGGEVLLQLHKDNLVQLVSWIHDGQAAAVAEAVGNFLQHLDRFGHPPAAIRGESNAGSVSDLTGDRSDRTEATYPLSESTGSALSGSTGHGASTEN